MKRNNERKLSEIIIEIAMQGLSNRKYAHSEVMHPLMFLAHVAWNRDTKSSKYLLNNKEYMNYLKKFTISKDKIRNELISEDWENILGKMIFYKKQNFTNDKRIITLCSYTPWGTLRVEWE